MTCLPEVGRPMRDVLFVQGGGPRVHAEWDVHLVESLVRELGPRYDVRFPPMPDEADPQLESWRPTLERELAGLGPGAVVVGHSVGGTIVINVLADAAPSVALGAVMLIAAPFIGDGGWQSDEMTSSADLAGRLPADVPVFLYHGEDDDVVPISHVELYARAMPHARVRRLPGRDHQLNNDLREVASDIGTL